MRKLLTLRDLLLILPYSEPTLRRYIADSRRGIGNFPKSVAKSVNASNVPLGDSSNTFERNGRQCKKATVPKHRTEYIVSVSADSLSDDDLLARAVSFYPHCKANTPSGTTTIGDFLNDCKDSEYREQVETIRAEPNEETRKELKKKFLPAITPNANPQRERNNVACEEAGRTGVVQIDLDDIPANELPSAIKAIVALPYVLTVGLSASGTGLFVLIACEGTPDLKQLIAALQADFPYEIDKSRSDLCGLRFATFDENLIIKDEVYPAVLTEIMDNSAVSVSRITKNTGENSISTYTDADEQFTYVPFPVDYFPAAMRNMVKNIQKVIGLKDSSTPAVCCLAVVSAVKHRIRRTYPAKTGMIDCPAYRPLDRQNALRECQRRS